MVENHYEAKPFTSYWYYANASKGMCSNCQTESSNYLMRYRIFLSTRFPIFPVTTNYLLVCSHCGYHTQVHTEGKIALIISGLKNKKPVKYNKYSQLDFEEYTEDELMIFGTDTELNKKIQSHLMDMRR